MITVATSISLSIIVWAWLEFSTVGKMIRAVACDPELSLLVGIKNSKVKAGTFAVGSGLAAVAAILIGYDTDITPASGFKVLLIGVVAVIVGGVDSTLGIIFGGFFIGMVQHLGVWKLPTQWQDAIVFMTLVLFLLLKPQGFFGRSSKKAMV